MRVTAATMAKTEEAIRGAARRLFVEKGLEHTSTREIAAAAGIGIGTLFNYFPSKEELAISIAGEALVEGRAKAHERLDARRGSLEEDLFTLIACDIRALAPIRSLVGEVLEAGLAVFTGHDLGDATVIHAARLEDAGAALRRHGLADAVTAPVMHLYWSLYLGVLSYWSADHSPNQEDSWALLDKSVRMFTGALRPPTSPPTAISPTLREVDR